MFGVWVYSIFFIYFSSILVLTFMNWYHNWLVGFFSMGYQFWTKKNGKWNKNKENENQIILYVWEDKKNAIFSWQKTKRNAIQFFRSRWNSTICLFVHILLYLDVIVQPLTVEYIHNISDEKRDWNGFYIKEILLCSYFANIRKKKKKIVHRLICTTEKSVLCQKCDQIFTQLHAITVKSS